MFIQGKYSCPERETSKLLSDELSLYWPRTIQDWPVFAHGQKAELISLWISYRMIHAVFAILTLL